MFVTLISHTHPAAQLEKQLSELETRIIPIVKQQPGFHSGTWSFDAAASRSHSHLVWESEDAATRFVAFLRAQDAQPNPYDIRLEGASVVKLLATSRV